MNSQIKRTFLTIWSGQILSLFGTHMTRFALLIWAYQATGQATSMALMGVFSFGSIMLVSPIAGYWIDRLDRRKVMLWSDMGGGIVILLTLFLTLLGHLELWHLYLGQSLMGALEAFQSTAYTALNSSIIPKEQYGRANGMRYLGLSISEIAAPLFATAVLAVLHLEAVLLINVITFLISVLLLIRLKVPQIAKAEKSKGQKNIVQELKVAWEYIVRREGLVSLLLIVTIIEFLAAFSYMSIFPAMILARTNGNELTLSLLQAAIGVGGLMGSILMSLWGGPKRKVHGALGLCSVSFLLGDMLFGLGHSNLVWIIGAVGTAFFFPFITGSELAIWQEKVPSHLQGRVLNIQYTIRYFVLVLGYLCGGLLADHLFEPMMQNGSWMAHLFGGLVGTEAGSGMALMFLITGVLGVLVPILGYFHSPLFNIESELPDVDYKSLAKQAQGA